MRQQIRQILRDHPDLETDDVARVDTIEGATDAFSLLSRLEHLRQTAECNADALERHIEQLEKRQHRFYDQAARMRSLMEKIMQEGNLRYVPLPEATLSLRPAPPRVVVTDEKLLPAMYTRVLTSPDKGLIRQALLSKADVPGCTLSNQPDTLSIRTT